MAKNRTIVSVHSMDTIALGFATHSSYFCSVEYVACDCRFHGTVYPCPETQSERREMAMGVVTRIEDLRTVS